MSYDLKEPCELSNSVLPFLKGKKSAVQYWQKQIGLLNVLHIVGNNFNEAEIST